MKQARSHHLQRSPLMAAGVFLALRIVQMRGSMSQRAVAEPAAFERANYMRVLNAFDNRLV